MFWLLLLGVFALCILFFPLCVHGKFFLNLHKGRIKLTFWRFSFERTHCFKTAQKDDSIKPPSENCMEEDLKQSDNVKELSDKDFFTLLLQPPMTRLAFKHLKTLLKATVKLFRIKFKNSFVEGINAHDPMKNGYIAALLSALPSVMPFFAGFIFVMDWTNSLELATHGEFVAKVNVWRIILYVLVVAFVALRLLLLYFWMRYRYKKNALKFELSWWRKKIVNFIAAED